MHAGDTEQYKPSNQQTLRPVRLETVICWTASSVLYLPHALTQTEIRLEISFEIYLLMSVGTSKGQVQSDQIATWLQPSPSTPKTLNFGRDVYRSFCKKNAHDPQVLTLSGSGTRSSHTIRGVFLHRQKIVIDKVPPKCRFLDRRSMTANL